MIYFRNNDKNEKLHHKVDTFWHKSNSLKNSRKPSKSRFNGKDDGNSHELNTPKRKRDGFKKKKKKDHNVRWKKN